MELVIFFSASITGELFGEDHVGRERDQFLGILANEFDLAVRPPVFDMDVLAVLPAEVRESLPECRVARLAVGVAFAARHQHSDLGHPAFPLSTRRERPSGRCATERGDELPSSNVKCQLTPPQCGHADRNAGKITRP